MHSYAKGVRSKGKEKWIILKGEEKNVYFLNNYIVKPRCNGSGL
jgi:hypothetical protein